MQVTNLSRGLVGKDVLGALALLALVSGATTASVFVHVGTALATSLATVVPTIDGALFDLVVVAGLYLQAVVLAAVYRAVDGVYAALQRRAKRADSA